MDKFFIYHNMYLLYQYTLQTLIYLSVIYDKNALQNTMFQCIRN